MKSAAAAYDLKCLLFASSSARLLYSPHNVAFAVLAAGDLTDLLSCFLAAIVSFMAWMVVKRSKVETFVLVKSFLSCSQVDATEENPFKTMAYHSIEVKMFSSVENKPVFANWLSRQHKPDMSRTSEKRQ